MRCDGKVPTTLEKHCHWILSAAASHGFFDLVSLRARTAHRVLRDWSGQGEVVPGGLVGRVATSQSEKYSVLSKAYVARWLGSTMSLPTTVHY